MSVKLSQATFQQINEIGFWFSLHFSTSPSKFSDTHCLIFGLEIITKDSVFGFITFICVTLPDNVFLSHTKKKTAKCLSHVQKFFSSTFLLYLSSGFFLFISLSLNLASHEIAPKPTHPPPERKRNTYFRPLTPIFLVSGPPPTHAKYQLIIKTKEISLKN